MKFYSIMSVACLSMILSGHAWTEDIRHIESEDLSSLEKKQLIHEERVGVFLDENELIARNAKKDYMLSKIDTIADEHFEDSTDSYLEGYIQALVDVHYYEFNVGVYVNDRKVTLYNLPNNALLTNSIVTFVENLPEVQSVEKGETITDEEEEDKEQHIIRKQVSGIWFPQSTVVFQPLIADPREPLYSADFRYGDHIMGKYSIGVSLGDTFPIFRWRNVFHWKGDLQIDIQAGVWSVFKMGAYDNPNHEISELVNTDYLVGIPLSYAVNRWSFRYRIYHISSHLGDEFLVNHPGFVRKNPSMEAMDLITSYQVTDGVRLYFGPGWVMHSDDTYKLKPFYIEWGGEFRHFGHLSYYHRIYGTPFLAIFVSNWQTNHWQCSLNSQLGYEWSKLQGVGRKVRVYIGYYNGYSEGQFFKERTSYGTCGFSYGF